MNKAEIIDFFNHHSQSWDQNMIKDDAKMRRILDSAGVAPGVCVLDIGCGTGVMIDYYLDRQVACVTGVDIAPKMIAIAQEKFCSDPQVSFLCADAESYPFEKRYDCCVVFNAFPHFCSPESLLDNLCAALCDGGTLTVAHDRGRAALDRHHEGAACNVSCGLMSETVLAALFEAHGFTDVHTTADEGIYIVTGRKAATHA